MYLTPNYEPIQTQTAKMRQTRQQGLVWGERGVLRIAPTVSGRQWCTAHFPGKLSETRQKPCLLWSLNSKSFIIKRLFNIINFQLALRKWCPQKIIPHKLKNWWTFKACCWFPKLAVIDEENGHHWAPLAPPNGFKPQNTKVRRVSNSVGVRQRTILFRKCFTVIMNLSLSA